jgi:hypothetical protein
MVAIIALQLGAAAVFAQVTVLVRTNGETNILEGSQHAIAYFVRLSPTTGVEALANNTGTVLDLNPGQLACYTYIGTHGLALDIPPSQPCIVRMRQGAPLDLKFLAGTQGQGSGFQWQTRPQGLQYWVVYKNDGSQPVVLPASQQSWAEPIDRNVKCYVVAAVVNHQLHGISDGFCAVFGIGLVR